MIRRTRFTLVAVAALGVLLAGCGGSHDMDDMGMASPSSTTGASAADAMFAELVLHMADAQREVDFGMRGSREHCERLTASRLGDPVGEHIAFGFEMLDGVTA